MEQRPVCLSIGGSDSCGGAGIQADLRVFEALGVYGCSAITALTAQNPEHISHIQASSIPQFSAEIQALAHYFDIQSIKTGMLYDEAHITTLIRLKTSLLSQSLLVVDPVLIASSGKALFSSAHIQQSYEKLIRLADLWTPNLQEAAFFLGTSMDDPVEMASTLLLNYHTPVLLKGGHGSGDVLRDVFCDSNGDVVIYEHPSQPLHHAQQHGTGCRLASAIAANLALHHPMPLAIQQAHDWLQRCLKDNRGV